MLHLFNSKLVAYKSEVTVVTVLVVVVYEALQIVLDFGHCISVYITVLDRSLSTLWRVIHCRNICLLPSINLPNVCQSMTYHLSKVISPFTLLLLNVYIFLFTLTDLLLSSSPSN